MTTHFVYFFRHVTEPRFKIGFSKSPLRRAGSIGGRHTVSLRDSIKAGFATLADASAAEAELHAAFAEHCVPQPADQSGCTEWFDLKVWPVAAAFLADNAVRFRITAFAHVFDMEDILAQESATNRNRGGRRSNQGRQAEFVGRSRSVNLSLTQSILDKLLVIGGGNLSLGARIAAEIACPAATLGLPEVTAPRTPTEPPASA